MATLLVLVGPTASGKTGVAIELARALGGEIISADARQVYRRLDIGTAKPDSEDRAAAPHHLIDFVDPHDRYDVARFAREAGETIDDIRKRGGVPIVAGGAGLYIRALLRGLDVTVGRDDRLREELKSRMEQVGTAALHDQLRKVDPDSATTIHPNDGIRIVRALEVFELTGVPQSAHHRSRGKPRYEAYLAGIDHDRENLYNRIDSRFDQMMADGFLTEVERLLGDGLSPDLSCFRSPGYRELIAHIREELPLDEAVALGKRMHRRYAKRQMTWFRKENVSWFDSAEPASMAARIIDCGVSFS